MLGTFDYSSSYVRYSLVASLSCTPNRSFWLLWSIFPAFSVHTDGFCFAQSSSKVCTYAYFLQDLAEWLVLRDQCTIPLEGECSSEGKSCSHLTRAKSHMLLQAPYIKSAVVHVLLLKTKRAVSLFHLKTWSLTFGCSSAFGTLSLIPSAFAYCVLYCMCLSRLRVKISFGILSMQACAQLLWWLVTFM